jgi:nitrate reductase NapA
LGAQGKGPHRHRHLRLRPVTIHEGYTAAKLMKAGFRSNNLDPNARHCMASAVVGFMQTFGIDEPQGNYDDIEHTDTAVLWGANMAEMHPILWSRITNRRLTHKPMKVVNLSVYGNMSSDIADLEIIFSPSGDLAIQNYIAREIVKRDVVDHDFVKKHTQFATGPYDIGYGFRPKNVEKYASAAEMEIYKNEKVRVLDKWEAIGQRRKEGEAVEQKNAATPMKDWAISFDDFKAALEPYTLDYTAQVAKGDPDEPMDKFKAKLQQLADYYCDRNRKIVSYWTMGFNQHQRGSWVNEQAYMNHLLTGRQCKPGDGAFSLTGQPSACGTAREVGTFAHRLPADMVVMNPKHRAIAEKIWKLPAGTINPVMGSHFVKQMRDLEDGTMLFSWTQVNNPWQNTANVNHWIKAAREMNNFIVVADAYPGVSAKVADLILPAAMINEKWGAYGNAERRTQVWRQQVLPPGEARADIWMMMELSKRFKIKDVWGAQKIPGNDAGLPDVLPAAQAMGYSPEATLYDVLYATPDNKKYKWPDNAVAKGHGNHVADLLKDGWFPEKAMFEEYRQFGSGHGHDLAPFDIYHDDKVRGLRWPVVEKGGKWVETQWRNNEKYDSLCQAGFRLRLLRQQRRRAGHGRSGQARRSRQEGRYLPQGQDLLPPLRLAGREARCQLRPVAMHRSRAGTLALRHHDPARARTAPRRAGAVCWISQKDADAKGLKRNDLVWVESRRGKVKVRLETGGRNRVPRGMVYVPWFDEGVLINKVTLDSTCPLSKETDYKKCAVKIYKA